MEQHRYDAIVVGARCAGSPTAMLLARSGASVKVIERLPRVGGRTSTVSAKDPDNAGN